jgi:hypothetical protein
MEERKPCTYRMAVLLALLWACGLGWSEDQPGDAAAVSVAQYQATLEQWSQQVGRISVDPSIAAKLRSSLPKIIRVRAAAREIESSTAWFDVCLENLQKNRPEHRPAIIKQIQERLKATKQEAGQFAEPSLAGSDTQTKIKQILARREFRSVRGPSAWDMMMAQIRRWLLKILDKIFSRVAAPAQAGQLLVWIAIALASSVLAVWLKRRVKTAAQEVRREPLRFATPSSKSSRKWLAEAQAAAVAGKWRDAIHLAYWAAIARLEESGTWIPNRACTPREYLRLLPERNPQRAPLAELTQKFEIIWYGNREANSSDFQHVVAQLERLQCRL